MVVGIFLVIIVFRYYQLESRIKNQELRMQDYFQQEINLTGRVVKEPDSGETNTKLTIKVIETRSLETSRDRVSIKILVTVPRYPEYKYGDILEIKGILQEPPVFEGFNYKNYLKKDGILAVIYYPETKLLKRGEYNSLISFSFSKVLIFKEKLKQSVFSLLPSPQNHILIALIIGDQGSLSEDFKNKLNISSLRHIVAVSGFHVVILSSVSMSLFLSLGFRKKLALYLSLLFIFLFVLVTGLQVSAIRAAIMGSLSCIAPLLGRKSQSIRSIFIAAMALLSLNPFLIFYDIGFQLSFLAAMGIIYLSSSFNKWLKLIPNQYLDMREILATTLSAQIFTMPILVYNFGQLSLAAPLANILALPVITWAMVAGFVFAIIALILPVFGLILSFIPYFLITYFIKIVEIFSNPLFSQKFINIHWFWIFASYFILFPTAWHFNKKEFRV